MKIVITNNIALNGGDAAILLGMLIAEIALVRTLILLLQDIILKYVHNYIQELHGVLPSVVKLILPHTIISASLDV